MNKILSCFLALIIALYIGVLPKNFVESAGPPPVDIGAAVTEAAVGRVAARVLKVNQEDRLHTLAPVYNELILTSPRKVPEYALSSIQSPYTVYSLNELEQRILQCLYARERTPHIRYIGGTDKFDQKYKEMVERISAADDYLWYSLSSWHVQWYRYPNRVDLYFTFGYLTGKEQEEFVDAAVAEILNKIIRPGMNDHQKVKAIHDYIVTNVRYDLTRTEHSAYAALAKGYTVCQGYAMLTFKMLTAAGINIRIISGRARGEDHAWNLVELYGAWYHLDTTWDDPVPDEPGRIRYDFYCKTDDEMSATHHWERAKYPACTVPYVYTEAVLPPRIFGADRYVTAVNISRSGWEAADTVLLARGDDYADALAGATLAFQKDAPILLTPTASLHPATRSEIQRLGAKEAVILGGAGAVSMRVEQELAALGLNVERIAGGNRFETAALIACRATPEGADTAVVVYGRNFPDALAAAAYAARAGYPILLSERDSVVPELRAALEKLGVTGTIVAGGPGAISEKVFTQLPAPLRIGGPNRYATAVAMAGHFNPSMRHVYIATGEDFADAVAGAALAARQNSGILLVGGGRPGEVLEYINSHSITGLTILGGEGAVSNTVAAYLAGLRR